MLIKLTFAHNKHEFWVRADMVRSVERDPNNLLTTTVGTTLLTPQGYANYEVTESPSEVVSLVNRALRPVDDVTGDTQLPDPSPSLGSE